MGKSYTSRRYLLLPREKEKGAKGGDVEIGGLEETGFNGGRTQGSKTKAAALTISILLSRP